MANCKKENCYVQHAGGDWATKFGHYIGHLLHYIAFVKIGHTSLMEPCMKMFHQKSVLHLGLTNQIRASQVEHQLIGSKRVKHHQTSDKMFSLLESAAKDHVNIN